MANMGLPCEDYDSDSEVEAVQTMSFVTYLTDANFNKTYFPLTYFQEQESSVDLKNPPLALKPLQRQ